MPRTAWQVTLHVNVNDPQALHAAALALVRKLQSMPGIHASHYAELAGLLDAA